MSIFTDILLVIGTFGLIFLSLLFLFLITWGILSLLINILSGGYFDGLKDMLDDLEYCRLNLPNLLKNCPKNNEHK